MGFKVKIGKKQHAARKPGAQISANRADANSQRGLSGRERRLPSKLQNFQTSFASKAKIIRHSALPNGVGPRPGRKITTKTVGAVQARTAPLPRTSAREKQLPLRLREQSNGHWGAQPLPDQQIVVSGSILGGRAGRGGHR